MRDDRTLVLTSKLKLRFVCVSELVFLAGRCHVESMRTNKISNEDTDIFIQVETGK